MPELPDKSAAFMDWYLAVVEAAELTDKRYGVKGMNVWTPYGFRARRLLDGVIVREIEATGSSPVEFPTLIPEPEFQKEADHIKGFQSEVYWVTRGGASPLDVPLVLRPTSETAMYPVFALWVRSHRDLPLMVYQIVNTFRYETKTTRPFLRVREIHFFEEHTCQATDEAAAARVQSNLAAFRAMAEALALPYASVRRPDWDKFAGAYYTICLDIPIGDGRSLQIGSIHHYRENFSRPYGIRYETPDGTQAYVHQTTFGLSERLLGALVAVHGDQRGVAFPSSIAPIQVVLVPIPGASGGAAADPTAVARTLGERLAARGLRVHVDATDERPGAKYYRWELKGVPLRLEIGRREAETGAVSFTDRAGRKGAVPADRLEEEVARLLHEFDRRLAEAALERFRRAFAVATRLEELKGSHAIRVVPWCGQEACGHRIEEAIDGALLGTPEGTIPIDLPAIGGCIACGRTEGARWALASRPI
ncbi:MAG: proline--tRNA ligase [Thermoplasmata archaeon]